MKVISCLNLKGGSGKTTTAVNLAAGIGARDYKTRLLDLDPQGSASRWAAQSEDTEFSLLSGFVLARDCRHLTSGRIAQDVKTALEQARKDKVAVVVIDSPPELEDRSLVPAMVADLVLIPVTPSPLDVWAAQQAIDVALEAKDERGGEYPRIVLIPSRMLTSTIVSRELPATLEALGQPVGPGITQRVSHVEAAVVGQSIADYAPGTPAHDEFTTLTNYVLTELSE